MKREGGADLREAKMKQQAEVYYDRYRDHMDMLDESLMSKAKGGCNDFDYFVLGKMLEQYDEYEAWVNEEDTSLGALGRIPQIAHDVITVSLGQSIIPVVASVQPIDEEQGSVFFKQILANDTKGNLTPNQVITDPRSNVTTPQNYASSGVTVNQATTGGTLSYAIDLSTEPLPIRSGTLQLVLDQDTSVRGQDVGPREGEAPGTINVFGQGLQASYNAGTNVLTVDFIADPGAGNLTLTYQQNYETATDLPQVRDFFDHKFIRAKVFALKGTLGMLKSFALRKRFNMNAEEALSRTLVQEINAEIGGELIRKLVANSPNAGSPVQFDKTPPSGVSFFEHKQTLSDKYADLESVILGNAGRGAISTIVAGREVAAIIGTLPGFTKLSDGSQLGAHIFGTWNGMTVVRVNEQAILDSKKSIAMWKGPTPFEAAVVYSPYMPLATTPTLPISPNPLGSMKAAAVWAGVDSLVPNFSATLDMVIT